MIILRYIYAALSAVLPLLSIFRDGALLEFTMTLSSSVLPRFLELPQRNFISLPPALNSISEIENDLDTTLTDTTDTTFQSLDVHEHPFYNAADALWHSLVPVLDISSYNLFFYVFLAIASALLTFSITIIRRSLSRSQARSTPTSRIDIHESLEHIDKLGADNSGYSTPLVLPDDVLALDAGSPSGTPDTLAFDSCTEVGEIPDLKLADQSANSLLGLDSSDSGAQPMISGDLHPTLSLSDIFKAPDDTACDELAMSVDSVPFADVLFSDSTETSSAPVETLETEEFVSCANLCTTSHMHDDEDYSSASEYSNSPSSPIAALSSVEYQEPCPMSNSLFVHPGITSVEQDIASEDDPLMPSTGSDVLVTEESVNPGTPENTSDVLGSSIDDITLEGVVGQVANAKHETIVTSESLELNTTLLDTSSLLPSVDIISKATPILEIELTGNEPVSQDHVDNGSLHVDNGPSSLEESIVMVEHVIPEDKPASPSDVLPVLIDNTAEEVVEVEALPASTSFSLDPILSTPVHAPQPDLVEEVSTLGASGVFNLESDGPVTFVLDKEMALEFASQMDPTVMDMLAAGFAAEAPPLPEDSFILVPSRSIECGPLTHIEEADDSDTSLISPALTAIDERGQPLVFSTNFPFMSADSSVKSTFGERLDEQDWTLVNIALNEEGKFIFGGMQLPVDGSMTSISSVASTSVSSLDLNDLGHFEPNSLVVASRHSYSKSDSELQRFREIYRRDVRPVAPTRLDEPKTNELQQLVSRHGLINHDQTFHFYSPPREMEAAVRMLKRAVESVRVPSRKRLSAVQVHLQTAPRFQYGLSSEVFLGWVREQELRRTMYIKSYADVARGIRPSILSIDYEAPKMVVPPTPKFIGPMPSVAINRTRGSQDKYEVHPLEQVALDRLKARKMDATKAPRHPNYYTEQRSRKISAPSPFTNSSASSDGERLIRRTRSDFELGYKTEQSTNTNSANTTTSESERRHVRSASVRPRSSSVTPTGRRSSSWDLSNRTGIRGRNREDVAKSPLLETIAGSPPVSPPRNGDDGAQSNMPSFGETFGRVLNFSDAPVSSVVSTKAPLNGEFARVDDEDALVDFRDDNVEVLNQMGRPRRPTSRGSSSSSRRSSSVSSSRQPVWKP